ncbi:hypothetical protein CONCODRAFT_6356 [Conidiobolus coronatus NRRL 28638]|uniref:Uncharacterized protein n=1 Tax=Conidiobolus coronatus (strain ATCC 28846 / CBS 209.66 / NRRL 28638) TaxID=796925 RepID=A0A137P7R6_CONC2|nr:hypothetical protein CONCODRAFT_6356 [Conidiobolus coronatus NRRL 28638]|eukprot:KXN70984.1 hypothetical protein CONCODRAFT_6356 [Conidiobolus coronatus NRRL 28638]
MTDTIHNFKLLSTEFIELQSSKIPLKVYQSLTTGFRVILVDKPGSCCFGTIVVPTLCSDDSGLPHTLEHLIFCSSKNYPNRGYLEACSVRCLSNGTNAWTDNDHTAYTISTAGYEGMAYALPVFLDHVINPTLHDRDFVTEVYHIDGEGKQKGVVFSEMVSRETSQEDLLYRYLNKRLYRDTTTYSKECGGLTPDIAKLTNERIKNYHSEFYTLKNSTAILVGNNINDSLILEQLDNSPTFKTSGNSIDLKHAQEFPDPKISPPLTEPFTVNFPADDDGSIGSIGFNWYGPYHNDLEARLGLSLLLNYLTYDVSSPLQQAFVAIDHPWATEVYYDVSSAPRTSLMLQFTGVPYETDEANEANNEGDKEENDDEDEGPVPEELKHLFEPDFFKNKFLKVLKEALDNLNHDELKASIDHYQLEVLRSWEKNPDSNTTSLLIPLLVADRFTDLPLTQTLSNATKSFKLLSELGKKPLSYWRQLGYDWLLDSPCSNVLAVPNPELGEKLESERAQRQQETIKELGTEKLAEIAKDLEKIIEENKVKISAEDIDNLPPTPNLSNLSKLNINQNLISLEPKEDWPFPNLQIIETSTEFVTLRLGLSTKEIPIELYDYLVVFFALLYETEVRVPGEPPMTYQQVINKTKSLMESTSNTMGQSGDLLVSGWISDILFLTATGEPTKFEPMLDWMFNMLQFTYFTEDRILNVSKVLLSDIDDSLRWGFTLCSRLIDVVFNDKHQNKSNSLSKSLNFVNQKKKG